MSEPREKTSDWIMSSYIQDDPNYPCAHGIYKLAKPRQIICSRCKAVIINEREMDGISEWMNALCRGA